MASDWALSQISALLPLDTDSLTQILEYSSSLPESSAADHLKNLLGDSPAALDFISSFNQRRNKIKTFSSAKPDRHGDDDPDDRVPRSQAKPKKKKAPLNNLPAPRRPDDYGNVTGGYLKRQEEEDYMPSSSSSSSKVTSQFPLSMTPAAKQTPTLLDPALHNVHTKTVPLRSPHPSRTASPAQSLSKPSSPSAKPKPTSTKISIAGGTAMHGSSTTLNDLDSAIRTLELSTNPSLPTAPASIRRCPCQGSLHPLLAAAPNCLSCGKIICTKEGMGPCTFCSAALLTGTQIQDMISSLRADRAQERMKVNNAAQAIKAGKSTTLTTPLPPPTSQSPSTASLTAAQLHRDKLLTYQATNAQRTKVVDEAASFELPTQGLTQWGNAAERAKQLKAQQRVLREMQENARPEWERRKVVVSLDVDAKTGRAVKKVQSFVVGGGQGFSDTHHHHDGGDGVDGGDDGEEEAEEIIREDGSASGAGGAFSKNPLLGQMIRPVWRSEHGGDGDAGEGVGGVESRERRRNIARTLWRRVQDDADDNENVILNGGVYGSNQE